MEYNINSTLKSFGATSLLAWTSGRACYGALRSNMLQIGPPRGKSVHRPNSGGRGLLIKALV